MKREDIKIGMKVRWSTSHIIGEVYRISPTDESAAIKSKDGTCYNFLICELNPVNDTLKSRLKNGAVVELRNGDKLIVVDDKLVDLKEGAKLDIEDLNDDLIDITGEQFDVVKINDNSYGALSLNMWTWQRKESILDEVEKKYLSDVIRPFKDKINYIVKHKSTNYQCHYLRIRVKSKYLFDNEEYIDLPYFPTGTMYKNMELDKNYTLKELGLDVD